MVEISFQKCNHILRILLYIPKKYKNISVMSVILKRKIINQIIVKNYEILLFLSIKYYLIFTKVLNNYCYIFSKTKINITRVAHYVISKFNLLF